MSYHMIDGVRRSKAHPETFSVPSRTAKRAVKVGDYVKIGFEKHGEIGERLWFLVTARDRMKLEGMLHGNPIVVPMKYGQTHWFEARHILDIISK